MGTVVVNAFGGFGLGYSFVQCKIKADEIKQGGNFLLASPLFAMEVMMVGQVFSQSLSLIQSPFLRILAKVVLSIGGTVSIIPFALAACVHQGKYQSVQAIAKFFGIEKHLPDQPTPLLSKSCRYLVDYTGEVLRVVLVVGAVAKVLSGDRAMGAGLLTALAYNIIDYNIGMPRRVSLFLETYTPILTKFTFIKNGLMLNRVLGFVLLALDVIQTTSSYFPAISERALRKGDAVLRYIGERNGYFPIEFSGPTLAELDSPMRGDKNLDYRCLHEMLMADHTCFSVDPTHCGKPIEQFYNLPRDTEFKDYLTLFDSVDWIKEYETVKAKCKDDERFAIYLCDQIKVKYDEENFKKSFSDYLDRAASNERVSSPQFLANWLRKQIEILIGHLTGATRIQGQQGDLQDSLGSHAYILAYLKSLQGKDERKINFVDFLLQIAVEQGNYCARGVKRSAQEILTTIHHEVTGSSDTSEIDTYERRLRLLLLDKRNLIIQGQLDEQRKAVLLKGPIDVHEMDLYRIFLARAFIPLTDFERFDFGVRHLSSYLLFQSNFNPITPIMFSQYYKDLPDVFKKIGAAHFGVYLRLLIQSNTRLTDEEKQEIIDIFTENNNKKWNAEETNSRFQKVVLVMLGVLRYDAVPLKKPLK